MIIDFVVGTKNRGQSYTFGHGDTFNHSDTFGHSGTFVYCDTFVHCDTFGHLNKGRKNKNNNFQTCRTMRDTLSLSKKSRNFHMISLGFHLIWRTVGVRIYLGILSATIIR